MAARLGNENVAEWTMGVLIGPRASAWVPCTARVRTPRAGLGCESRDMWVAPSAAGRPVRGGWPGVGTDRGRLAVGSRAQSSVGRANGLLGWAPAAPAAQVHAVPERRHFPEPVSGTFHARDVFAPVAGCLARGEPLLGFGPRIAD